jgi:hypothetical protein
MSGYLSARPTAGTRPFSKKVLSQSEQLGTAERAAYYLGIPPTVSFDEPSELRSEAREFSWSTKDQIATFANSETLSQSRNGVRFAVTSVSTVALVFACRMMGQVTITRLNISIRSC